VLWLLKPDIAKGVAVAGTKLPKTTPTITAALNTKRRMTYSPSNMKGHPQEWSDQQDSNPYEVRLVAPNRGDLKPDWLDCGAKHRHSTTGMTRIVSALWPAAIAVLFFTPLGAAESEQAKSATPAFAPQITLVSIGKPPARRHRLKETSPQVRAKRGCPITAVSHNLFC
jgi:hypothetical protein